MKRTLPRHVRLQVKIAFLIWSGFGVPGMSESLEHIRTVLLLGNVKSNNHYNRMCPFDSGFKVIPHDPTQVSPCVRRTSSSHNFFNPFPKKGAPRLLVASEELWSL